MSNISTSTSQQSSIRFVQHDREELRRITLNIANNMVEKTGEVAKEVIHKVVDEIPTSSTFVAEPVKVAIVVLAPNAAPFLVPAVDPLFHAGARAMVANIRPRVDPTVDSVVDSSNSFVNECIESSIDSIPDSSF